MKKNNEFSKKIKKKMNTERTSKKRGFNRIKTANTPTNPERVSPKGKTHLRDSATIKRLNMYRSKPTRNKKGHIITGAFMSKELPIARIQPDRR